MEPITLQELLTATQGRLLGDVQDGKTVITGARSDNRQCGPGDVFFAFRGEKNDGHRFVDGALANGAAGAVVSEEPAPLTGESRLPSVSEDGGSGDAPKVSQTAPLYHLQPGKFYVLVPDTLQAAGDLARYYRGKFHIPVVGVTGSVGKTTMKDMIAAVLSQKYRTLKTQANFNNNIGLPRTVLRLSHDTQMAVLEMGMNHMGEIRYLVNIAQPTCAVITNIGEAHIGNLGSRENIFKAKCEIFEGLQKGGLAIMNADDEFLPRLRNDLPKQQAFRFLWIGESAQAQYRAVEIDDTLQECMKFRALTPQGDFAVTVPALGRHMIYPALASIAIGQQYGMRQEEILRGIASYVPTAMRMETYHCPGNIVIYNDTYNANPQSMKAGLTTLAHTKPSGSSQPLKSLQTSESSQPLESLQRSESSQQRKPLQPSTPSDPSTPSRLLFSRVAVLGDMLELGDMEEKLHREVGATAASLPIDTLICVGPRARWIADEAGRKGLADVHSCNTSDEARQILQKYIRPDTAIYFKASHLMALEKLAAWCKEQADAKS